MRMTEFAEADFVVFDGVFAINRITGKSTGKLAEFVVIDPIGPKLYPPMIATGPSKFRTVASFPATNAKPRLAPREAP